MKDRTFEPHSTGFIVSAIEQHAFTEPLFDEPDEDTLDTNASRRRRAVRGERIAVYLPPALVEELRVRCVRQRRSVSDAVTEAVSSWIQD
jgi:hypothetical protein